MAPPNIVRRLDWIERNVPSPVSADDVPAFVSNAVSDLAVLWILLYAVTRACTDVLIASLSRVTTNVVVPVLARFMVTPWEASTTALLWLTTSMPLIFSVALAGGTFCSILLTPAAAAGSKAITLFRAGSVDDTRMVACVPVLSEVSTRRYGLALPSLMMLAVTPMPALLMASRMLSRDESAGMVTFLVLVAAPPVASASPKSNTSSPPPMAAFWFATLPLTSDCAVASAPTVML
ncbi:hypothetical protein D9M68_457460 [compost metagenome]